MAKASARHSFFLIFLPFFAISTYTDLLFTVGDSNPAKLLPFSIEKEGNLELSEFFTNFEQTPSETFKSDNNTLMTATLLPSGNYIRHPFFLVYKEGRTLSAFPLLPGLYNTVVYFSLRCVGVDIKVPDKIDFAANGLKYHTETDFLYLEKFSASILFAFSSVLFFKFVNRFVSARTALLTTILYSFGTTHFSQSSQTLWQHGFVELLVILSMTLLFSRDTSFLRKYLSLGIVLGTFYFIRPPSIFLGFGFGIAFLFDLKTTSESKSRVSKFVSFTTGFLLINLLLGSINYFEYGNITGGYQLMTKAYEIIRKTDYFTSSFVEGCLGLLFSPGFGLFIYSPFIAFSFFGFTFWKKKISILLIPMGIATLAYLPIFSKYFTWWGGNSYGARFLTDLMPLLTVFIFPFITRSYKQPVFRTLFYVVAIVSIWANTSAVFSDGPYKKWSACYHLPTEAKIWDWKNVRYTYPLKRYYPLITGQIDFEPLYECHAGSFRGFIKGRYAFQFDETNLLPLTEKISPDTALELSSGNYCLGTFLGSEKETHNSGQLQIIISQGKDTIFNQIVGPEPISSQYEPSVSEVYIPKTSKTRISLLKTGKGPIIFGGIRLKKAPCKELLLKREESRPTTLLEFPKN
ncbi:dolichyl-phosphate-mannose--protein mannosyltransferase [Leptospira langatensis]|nr:dolichyl-phosphate-mannose--protein mannosyltransferase [Leptospira langatensis]